MLTLHLHRTETSDHGTFGRLRLGPEVSFFTGELPWRDNAPNISCIPQGEYRCLWTPSNRFKRMMYLIDGVPDRAGVRIHSANFMGDKAKGLHMQLNGCIALGEGFGLMGGQKALLRSSPAVRRFERLMLGQVFMLKITGVV